MAKKITTTMTDDELRALVAANAVAIREMRAEREADTEKWRAEREADSKKWRTEMDEFKAEMKEFKADMRATVERMEAGTEALRIEMRAGTEALRNEMHDLIENLNATFGRFGDRLGEITEITVAPGIRPALSKVGHDFDTLTTNKVVKWPNGKKAFEIDIFLDNCKEAMAVEIKTRLGTGAIDSLLIQLKKIRECETNMNIKNKALYGGIAGLVIDDPVKKYAAKKGIFLFQINEDNDRLTPIAPPTAKVGVW